MPHHQAFVDYFVHEFMEELWYLQKVARGDITARQDADPWQKFFNVTQGLLSLAPIPGLPLGFLLSKELIRKWKCADYGEALRSARQANAEAKAAHDKSQEFLAKIDQLQEGYELLAGKPESKGMLQQEGPMDLTAIRVLVELVGRGLAKRYEHVLSHYIDTSNPEKSYIPLARVMAKRLFEYLQSEPLLAKDASGDWTAQSMRLLNGVVLAKVDKSWREQITSKGSGLMPRFLKDMHKVELPLQTESKKQLGMLKKFTAEGVIKRSAWYDDNEIYARPESKTEWWESKGQPTQPKYGYAYISYSRILPKKDSESLAGGSYTTPPRDSRYYQPVSVANIQKYLATPEIKAARAAKQTASLSFHAYLQQQKGRPKHLQAVCHENLAEIENWSFANFQGVDFSGATLTGNFSGAQFSNAYLVGAVANEVFCDENYPANFSKAQLGFGDWRGARLPKADFAQADLSLVNFSGADLTAIHTEGTVWYKADLTGITRKDLLAEQAKHVEASQAKLRNSLAQLEKQVEALEQRLEPELEKLHALEEQSKQTASTTQKLTEKMAELQTELAEKTVPLEQKITALKQQMAQAGGNNADLSKQIQQLQQQITAQNVPLREQIAILQIQTQNANKRMEMVTAEIVTLQTTLHDDLNKAFKSHCDQILQRLDERMDSLDKNIAGVQRRVDEQAGGINKNIAGVQESLDEHADNIRQNIDHVKEKQDKVLDSQERLFAALEKQQQATAAMQQAQPELAKLLKELLAREFGSLQRVLSQYKLAEQKPVPQEEKASSVTSSTTQTRSGDRMPENKAFQTGYALYHQGQYQQALPHLEQAADAGNIRARLDLGVMYELGLGVEQDAGEATIRYDDVQKQEAELLKEDNRRDAAGQFYIGRYYQFAAGSKKDLLKAKGWYQRAAKQGHADKQGHAEAQCSLGDCYANGIGVSKDLTQAKHWYEKAKAQGNVRAIAQLSALQPAPGVPHPMPSVNTSSSFFPASNSPKPDDKVEVKQATNNPPQVAPKPVPEKSAAPVVVDEKALGQLLKFVVEGEQDQAEALIKKDSKLLLAAGTVTDLSDRTFDNITAFQYALWAMDYHMWTMIQKHLPAEAQAKQHALLESKGTVHGKHFDLQPLLDALKTYVDNYNAWSDSQCREHWCKKVGGAQKLLPAHVVNEYCRPDRPFDPCPTEWTSNLPRTRAVKIYKDLRWENGEWFTPLVVDSSKILGSSFAFMRGSRDAGGGSALGRYESERLLAFMGWGWLSGVPRDLQSLRALWTARTQQLKLLADTFAVEASTMQVGLK